MLSSYEQERLARIKQNQSFLEQLDIKTVVCPIFFFFLIVKIYVSLKIPEETKVKKRKEKPKVQSDPTETRRSGRLEGKVF